jgi:hypothetical protein
MENYGNSLFQGVAGPRFGGGKGAEVQQVEEHIAVFPGGKRITDIHPRDPIRGVGLILSSLSVPRDTDKQTISRADRNSRPPESSQTRVLVNLCARRPTSSAI